jgi:hypothetical protein
VSILLWKVWGLRRNLKHEQKCDDKYVGTSERGPYKNSCGDGRVPLDGSASNTRWTGPIRVRFNYLTEQAWNKQPWTRSMAYWEIDDGWSERQRQQWQSKRPRRTRQEGPGGTLEGELGNEALS